MRLQVRISLLALLAFVVLMFAAPVATAAEFGIEKFFAANCQEGAEECGLGAEGPETEEEAEEEGFQTAGAYVPFGVTDFVLKTETIQTVPFPAIGPAEFAEGGSVKNLRVDVGPGVVTNPEAVPKCSQKDFKSTEAVKGIFFESTCPSNSVIGVNSVETAVVIPEGTFKGDFADVKFKGKVYNLEQPVGLGSEFGVALDLEKEVAGKELFAHTYIDGNVEWASDYHDYYVIKDVTPGLISSRLVFKGNKNEKEEPTGFIRNPTACRPRGPATTTTLSAESYAGASTSLPYEDLVGANECGSEEFNLALALTPETALSDTPDGLSVTATVAHPPAPERDVSDLEGAEVTLPEGLTINPAGAKGLEGCTPEQIGIGTREPVTCPPHSQIGTFTLNVPTVPDGSLTGPIFLGKPAGKAIEKPPYTIYLDAESARYDAKVRVEGTVEPNPVTGQLTTKFSPELPQAPFKEAVLHFFGGGSAPLANALLCGTATAATKFTPFSGNAPLLGETEFTTEGCTSSPPPFNWTQTSTSEPAKAGASSTFTLNLERSDGQQYIAGLRNLLPPGLVGIVPSVTLCGEAEGKAGTCTAASQIGTATVAAGAGSEPFIFKGKIYLTGPFEGAPYGLSIVVPAIAGPVNLGNVIATAKIEVDPHTAQVIASDPKVPTIVGGIPVRQKAVTLSIDRQGFERNPTNCTAFATETTLTSTLGATQQLSSPFQVEGCESLAFKPSFSASTSAKTSKLNGASLEVKISQGAGQANLRRSVTSLPIALPSRLTTLQKACLEATFAANPLGCSAESQVGTATAVTPTLSKPLSGPAYLVSHGGAAFPDLDLVLEGNGVRIILVGNTDIKNGITTTTFASVPDAPVSSFTLKLPTGPHSALTANRNLCTNPLVMPTTLTGQNGKVVKQNTIIAVKGCGVQIVGRKVVGSTAFITVRTPAAGRVSAGGRHLVRVVRSLSRATKAATLRVPLTRASRHHRRALHVRVRVGFVPRKHGPHSSASATVTFR
jgi:hypothetical protein